MLMFVDHRQHHLSSVRASISTLMTPLLYLANLPADIFDWSNDQLRSRSELLNENNQLKDEQLILKAKVQQLITLEAENARLRNLLGSARKEKGKRLVAEILNVNTEAVSHQIVLNKGSLDDVFIGQAVLDAQGIIGQIIEVTPFTSRVLLITDSNHAIPVRIERNGLQSIAHGTGQLNLLVLTYVSNTTDVQKGDLLLSSGLGEKFPDGYPVARVSLAEKEPGEPFIRVEATAVAHLGRSGQVLLIWPDPIAPSLSIHKK